MPFLALCNICGDYVVGIDEEKIANEISKHFKSHNSSPLPNPHYLRYPHDFIRNHVSVTSYPDFSSFEFYSEDYRIALISWSDFESTTAEDKNQKHISELLSVYFPSHQSKEELEEMREKTNIIVWRRRERFLSSTFGISILILPLLAITSYHYTGNNQDYPLWFTTVSVADLIIMLSSGAPLLLSSRTRSRFISFLYNLYKDMRYHDYID